MFGDMSAASRLRAHGLELRDTILVLLPGPEIALAFLARKPTTNVLADVLNTATGALYIDGCRVPTQVAGKGRWPTNVVILHAAGCSDDCCEPACAASILDTQSGLLTSGVGAVFKASSKGYRPMALGQESRPEGTRCIEYGDSGGASRFYPSFRSTADLETWMLTLIGD